MEKFIKKFEAHSSSNDTLIINKISRYLSDMFYPNVSKNTFPIKCGGFTELDAEYEVYFLVWDDNKNDYKEFPVTTILVPKYVIKM